MPIAPARRIPLSREAPCSRTASFRLAWIAVLNLDASEELQRRCGSKPGSRHDLRRHFPHGRRERGPAIVSKEGLYRLRPVASGFTACAGRLSTQGPVSECRQRTDKNGELFSNLCGARTIHSLIGIV